MSKKDTPQFNNITIYMETKDDLAAWEANAAYWDDYMGNESNFFHNDLVRPKTDELLQLTKDDYILDIACGNGNYSAWMAAKGAQVVAFDFSPTMVELAKKRRDEFADNIRFYVCDATDYNALIALATHHYPKQFNKAVANMALMDISNIEPLFKALHDMLSNGGRFVFSFHHPCFTSPNKDYLTPIIHKGVAIEGQPLLQCYFHRSLQDVLNLAFKNGFSLDGFYEIPLKDEGEPIIVVIKITKRNDNHL